MLQGSGQCSPARHCYSNPGARLWARGALDNEQTWFDGLMDCHYHFLNPNPGDVRYQYADITSNQVQRVEVAAPVVIEVIWNALKYQCHVKKVLEDVRLVRPFTLVAPWHLNRAGRSRFQIQKPWIICEMLWMRCEKNILCFFANYVLLKISLNFSHMFDTTAPPPRLDR